MGKPTMLIILDGWGIGRSDDNFNAAAKANTPHLTELERLYPHTTLQCSGEAVGLPAGQMGNSEVGHLNIGAGRVVYQELTRISKSIRDGDFFKNEVLLNAMSNARDNKKALHLMGLLSDGGVHSHIEHLFALIKLAKIEQVTDLFIHCFLDGRDVAPRSAKVYLAELEAEIKKIGVGKIATVIGRYYVMDRDNRWERVEKAYDAMVHGTGKKFADVTELIDASYADNTNDEFVLPAVICNDKNSNIKKGDSVIFFNFRPDRAREITRALTDKTFSAFDSADNHLDLNFLCMTQYDEKFTLPIAYPPSSLTETLGEVLAKNKMKQLRIAETEKYAHVTFFFNGGVEHANDFEDRVLIPSPKVSTYDLQPEMSAIELTNKVIELIDNDKYDVIILNFANPDMVGHTGVFPAACSALETVDTCIGKIWQTLRAKGGTALVTADHGNLDQMVDFVTGQPHTAHTTNNVKLILLSDELKNVTLKTEGKLSDIAPTLLSIIGVEKPTVMTGSSLIEK